MRPEFMICAVFAPHLIGIVLLVARGKLNKWLVFMSLLLTLSLLLILSPPSLRNDLSELSANTRASFGWVYLGLPFLLILAPLWVGLQRRGA